MKNYVIKLHPAVVHMFDGDFDGDTAHVAIPIQKKSREDLVKMDVLQFIINHPEEFRPGKEIAKYKDFEWAQSSAELKYQLELIRRRSTNGSSISYRDIVDMNKTGYFNGTKVDRKELSYFGRGLEEEEVSGLSNPQDPSIKGVSTRDAVRDYRTIKTLVPKSGGLSNSLMALALSKLMDKCAEEPGAIEKLKKIAHAKHILCQDGLSAKHGTNKIVEADRLYGAFYDSKDNELTSEEDYVDCMRSFGLPAEDIEAVMDIYWTGEPVNINEVLVHIATHYVFTRRGANLGNFEDAVEIGTEEKSLQKEFLNRVIPIKEVSDEVKIPTGNAGRRKDRVSGSPASVRVPGGTSNPVQPQGKVKRGVVKASVLTGGRKVSPR